MTLHSLRTISPRSHEQRNLTVFDFVVVRMEDGSAVTINRPSVAYVGHDGKVTVSSRRGGGSVSGYGAHILYFHTYDGPHLLRPEQ